MFISICNFCNFCLSVCCLSLSLYILTNSFDFDRVLENKKKVKENKIAAIKIDFERNITDFHIENAGNKKGTTLDQDI